MEADRYQQNKKLFLACFICIILSLSLTCFALYILPPLVLEWRYNIPEFTFAWRESVKQYYNISEDRAGFIVFLLFFIPALITAIIAYFTGNRVENEVQGLHTHKPIQEEILNEDLKASASLSLKIFGLIILIFIGVVFFQWLLMSLL